MPERRESSGGYWHKHKLEGAVYSPNLGFKRAPSWLVSSVGRALHRNRRGHGFKSRTGLIFFFRPYFHYCLSSAHYCEDPFHSRWSYVFKMSRLLRDVKFIINLAHGDKLIGRFYYILHGFSNKNLRLPSISISQIHFW